MYRKRHLLIWRTLVFRLLRRPLPIVLEQASLLAGHVQDAPYFGWRSGVDEGGHVPSSEQSGQGAATHNWGGMIQGVQNFIKGLNFKYRTDLRSKGVSGSI